jgi:hypothetical protein
MRRARASPDSGPPIERVGSGDRAMLAMSAGAVVQQQLGAVLLLDTGPEFDLSRAERLLAERVATIARLRQRLIRPPLGGGGPSGWTTRASTSAGTSAGCIVPGPGTSGRSSTWRRTS